MMLRKILSISVLLILFVASSILPVAAEVEFPIGYVSRGGTYAFISLIEQHKPTFVYIGGPQVSQALISGDIRMAIVAAASPKVNHTRGVAERVYQGEYSSAR